MPGSRFVLYFALLASEFQKPKGLAGWSIAASLHNENAQLWMELVDTALHPTQERWLRMGSLSIAQTQP